MVVLSIMPVTSLQLENTKRLKETLDYSLFKNEEVTAEQEQIAVTESKRWLEKSQVKRIIFESHIEHLHQMAVAGSFKETDFLRVASNPEEAFALAWQMTRYASQKRRIDVDADFALAVADEMLGVKNTRYPLKVLRDLYHTGVGFLSFHLPLEETDLIFKAGFPQASMSAVERFCDRSSWDVRECEYLFAVASQNLPNFKRIHNFRTRLTNAVTKKLHNANVELSSEFVQLFRDYNTLGQVSFFYLKPAVMKLYGLDGSLNADVYMNSAVLDRYWDIPLVDVDNDFARNTVINFGAILDLYKKTLLTDELELLEISEGFVREALRNESDPIVPLNMPVYGFGAILAFFAHVESILVKGLTLSKEKSQIISIYFEELENCIPSWLLPALMAVDSPVEEYMRYNSTWIPSPQVDKQILADVLKSERFKDKVSNLVALQMEATSAEEQRKLVRLLRLQDLFSVNGNDRQWKADVSTVELFLDYTVLLSEGYFTEKELLNFGHAKFSQDEETDSSDMPVPDTWVLKMVESVYGLVSD